MPILSRQNLARVNAFDRYCEEDSETQHVYGRGNQGDSLLDEGKVTGPTEANDLT
jgi:hypothetical protein